MHGICDYDEETRYSIDQFKAEIAESCYPSYDCGTNIALFKALAAMNDENDYMQLFINKSNRYRWVLCNAQRLFDAVAKECDWRKATAAEIVEHFKK